MDLLWAEETGETHSWVCPGRGRASQAPASELRWLGPEGVEVEVICT